MKILHNRILAKPIKEETTKNGIILPNSAQNKNIAEVLLIGEKTKVIQVGDKIKYHEYSGIGINYNNEDCLFLSEEHDVICVL